MLINLEQRIQDVRSEALERKNIETSGGDTFVAGEGLWSDNEIKQKMIRDWNRLYSFVLDQLPKMVIENRDVTPENIIEDTTKRTLTVELLDIWKLMDVYVFYSSDRVYPYKLQPVEFEDMFDFYEQNLASYDINQTIGYFFENKTIYLPFRDANYLIKYLKESIPIEEADMPDFFWDYLVVSTACQMKIAGQEAEAGSAIVIERNRLWREIKSYILTHRNKGNPRKIKKVKKALKGLLRP